jgi:hypothetical protein
MLCTALILRCVHNALVSGQCFWAPSVPSVCFETLLQHDQSVFCWDRV